MKLVSVILTVLIASPVFAATFRPKLINCTNERGLELQIKQNVGEVYEVSWEGQETFDAVVSELTEDYFSVHALDLEHKNTILSAGYSFKRKEGFFGKSANGGMSPFPAVFFKECAIR